MKRTTASVTTGFGLVVLLGLAGCSMSMPERRVGPSSSAETEAVVPTTEETVVDIMPEEEAHLGIPVEAKDLELASSSFSPKVAVSGSYIVVTGYKYFDTLTVFVLDTGEKVYFATDGGAPFGSLNSGLSIAADQASRELTGFGEGVPANGPAGLDAAQMLADHKADLG